MRRSKRKAEGMVKDDGYLVLRHVLSKVGKGGRKTGGSWEERKGKECEKEMEREGRAEPVGVWVFDDCYRCSQQRWKGRRKRTKDGGRSSKGKMRVKEDKVRLKTMSACFLGWKGRKKERCEMEEERKEGGGKRRKVTLYASSQQSWRERRMTRGRRGEKE